MGANGATHLLAHRLVLSWSLSEHLWHHKQRFDGKLDVLYPAVSIHNKLVVTKPIQVWARLVHLFEKFAKIAWMPGQAPSPPVTAATAIARIGVVHMWAVLAKVAAVIVVIRAISTSQASIHRKSTAQEDATRSEDPPKWLVVPEEYLQRAPGGTSMLYVEDQAGRNSRVLGEPGLVVVLASIKHVNEHARVP